MTDDIVVGVDTFEGIHIIVGVIVGGLCGNLEFDVGVNIGQIQEQL